MGSTTLDLSGQTSLVFQDYLNPCGIRAIFTMSSVMNLLTDDDGVAEARIFVFNLTSGSVSAAYGTVIILAVAFAIAAIGALLYYGLQNMSRAGYGYSSDSYDYKRYEDEYYARSSPRTESLVSSILSQISAAMRKYSHGGRQSEVEQ